MPTVEEAFDERVKTTLELSIEAVRMWSKDNLGSPVDWRALHAVSNITAIEQYESAETVKQTLREMIDAEDELARVEGRAFARLYMQLVQGLAMGPDSQPMPKVSPSQAEPIARKMYVLVDEVIAAKARYSQAKSAHAMVTRQHDALKEIEQGAKSTAQQLNREPQY